MSETRYPDRYPVTHEIGAILADFEVLSAGTTPIAVAGRVMTIRGMGKVIFADIQDITGRIQLFVQAKELGEAEFEKFRETIRIGDIVGVSGVLFVTRTLERSVRAGSYRTLSKMLHHMPDKH
ncbi:MAG TPA: OB-fold nucleic acid binding domain-containing protein, partial [Candidatus Magasanikbacteria bacterium]|nr:OB-fold nucleic acid binding domain-containing protein [Candidatus Magasanikbacteria bacterium]